MLNCWKTMAQRMRQARNSAPFSVVTSLPFQRMLPEENVKQAVRHAQQRGLAGARAAITPTKLPGATDSVTSLTAAFSPKRRVTFLNSSMADSSSDRVRYRPHATVR